MRCLKCSKDFPSVYYFQAPGVCNECFEKMSPAEREQVRQPAPMLAMTTTAFTLDGYRIISPWASSGASSSARGRSSARWARRSRP